MVFRPPTVRESDGWRVDDSLAERVLVLDSLHALIALYFARPQSAERAAFALENRCGVPFDIIVAGIEWLFADGVIVERIGPPVPEWTMHVNKTRSLWWSYGWINACEYHLATYDSRFIPVTKEGRLESDELMKSYANNEVDQDRTKIVSTTEKLRLPDVEPSLIAINYGQKPNYLSQLRLQELSSVLSVVFGPVRKTQPSWNGAPLIFRTSPSGGARHPTEGYLISRNIEGLSPGLYHISIDPPTLAYVKAIEDLPDCYVTMLERSEFSIAAVIILTTVFERNMYRYRESRTYRTVHMDAGHICGSLEILLKHVGLRTFVQYGPDDQYLQDLIGSHPLEEGVQISIGIGTARRSDV